MTTRSPDAGRQVGHVLLDAVIAYVPLGDVETSSRSANLALSRIDDIEELDLLTFAPDGSVTLDLSDVLGGALVVTSHLVDALARARDCSREEVVSSVRSYLG